MSVVQLENNMKKYALFAFSLLVYGAFGGVFVYLIAFLADSFVPKTVNAPTVAGSMATAVLVNLLLVTLFGVAHSGFARRPFKQWLTRFVPGAAERSLYVLQAISLLALLMWLWRPLPTPIWSIENGFLRLLIWTIFGLGWGLVLLSSFLIDHFELMGLAQAWRGKVAASQFKTPLLYKWSRHPMMVGFLLAFWATPTMTLGHLLLASGMTLYIAVGVQFEERDLIHEFGETYRAYRQRTPMLLPNGRITQSTPTARETTSSYNRKS